MAEDGGLALSYGLWGGYDAWHRFGRIVEQMWTVDGQDADSYLYQYDMNSNRTSSANVMDEDRDDTYAYDALYRLLSMERGEGFSPRHQASDCSRCLGRTGKRSIASPELPWEAGTMRPDENGVRGGRQALRARKKGCWAATIYILLFMAACMAPDQAMGATPARQAVEKALALLGPVDMVEDMADIRNADAVTKALDAYPLTEVLRALAAVCCASDDPAMRARAVLTIRILAARPGRSDEQRYLAVGIAEYAIWDEDATAAFHAFYVLYDYHSLRGREGMLEARIRTASNPRLADALLLGIGECGEIDTLIRLLPGGAWVRADQDRQQRWAVALWTSMRRCPSNYMLHPAMQDALTNIVGAYPPIATSAVKFIVERGVIEVVPRLEAALPSAHPSVRPALLGALVVLKPASADELGSLLSIHGEAAKQLSTDPGVWQTLVTANNWIAIIAAKRDDKALIESAWDRYKDVPPLERACLLGAILSRVQSSPRLTAAILGRISDEDMKSMLTADPSLASGIKLTVLNEYYPYEGSAKDDAPMLKPVRERIKKLIQECRGRSK